MIKINILVKFIKYYYKVRFSITDYSSSPDTSCSSLSSESTPIPLTNNSNISFGNKSSQLSGQTTRPSRLSKTSTG